jgi:hypothetical protein
MNNRRIIELSHTFEKSIAQLLRRPGADMAEEGARHFAKESFDSTSYSHLQYWGKAHARATPSDVKPNKEEATHSGS